MIVRCEATNCGYFEKGFCTRQVLNIGAHGVCTFTALANKTKDTREFFLEKNPVDARPVIIEDVEKEELEDEQETT